MITIIDYDAGNIRSVQRACLEIGARSVITSHPENVINAERIIFPGIGAATSAVQYIKRTGLDVAFKQAFEDGDQVLFL